MGNAIGITRKKYAKIMKIDGSIMKVKSQTQASTILLANPGYTLLDSEEVKQKGIRALPLQSTAPLQRGKIYFLVELPKQPTGPLPRRAWSGQLVGTAKDRLEMLRLTRRSASDVGGGVGEEEMAMRVKMRLPKAEVEKVVKESRDSGEAARRIMELCGGDGGVEKVRMRSMTPPPSFTMNSPMTGMMGTRAMTPPASFPAVKAKKARFVELPDEIIA